jgi:hypothetical protein
MNRIRREPLVHFFILAIALFLVHHWVVGDSRTVDVSAGTRTTLARRFRDQSGRAPTAAEEEAALRDWKRDEALYREALREQLDRDDPSVRAVLIEKIRARATLEAPKREPSAAELDQWLATNRSLYETPRRFTIDWVAFPKQPGGASEQREKFERALQAGADPRFQGHTIHGATLKTDDVREKLGARLAGSIGTLPLQAWQRAESDAELLLVRVNQVEGGLPSPEELRPRLVVDWSSAEQQKYVEQSVKKIVDRYRFREQH